MLGYSRLYRQYNSCCHKKREYGRRYTRKEKITCTGRWRLQSYWIYKPRNAEDGRQLPEARGDEEGFLSQSLQREHAPADTFISDYENKFLLLSVTQFIILCLGSPRKVIHMFMEGLTSFPIFLKLIYKSNTTAIKIPACFKKF